MKGVTFSTLPGPRLGLENTSMKTIKNAILLGRVTFSTTLDHVLGQKTYQSDVWIDVRIDVRIHVGRAF